MAKKYEMSHIRTISMSPTTQTWYSGKYADSIRLYIDNLNGFSEENLAELNESIKNMIRSKLSEPSFGSKLDNLINRLAIPISTDEKVLLNKARKIRNELIHGLNMSTISTLEMKKLCGITSRVLIYKLIDGLKKE